MPIAYDSTWPTRTSDLAMAKMIIDQHASQQNGLLRLLDECSFNADNETVRLTLPPWIEALAASFNSLYGEKQYPYILSNVLQCLVEDFVAKGVMSGEYADVFNALILATFHPDAMEGRH